MLQEKYITYFGDKKQHIRCNVHGVTHMNCGIRWCCIEEELARKGYVLPEPPRVEPQLVLVDGATDRDR